MDIETFDPPPEHHSPADEFVLADVDPQGIWVVAPDGASVSIGWDELRAEAQADGPSAFLFRDLLMRAESFRRAA